MIPNKSLAADLADFPKFNRNATIPDDFEGQLTVMNPVPREKSTWCNALVSVFWRFWRDEGKMLGFDGWIRYPRDMKGSFVYPNVSCKATKHGANFNEKKR